jgi:hypothetical protein
MDDVTFAAERERVETYFTKWISLLRLDRQQIAIDYRRSYPDVEQHSSMTTEPRWRYHRAIIKVYPVVTRNLDDETLEGDVVHELVHVLMGPLVELYEYKNDEPSGGIDEFVTSSIAFAILNAFTCARSV